jgi:hypothetical protein
VPQRLETAMALAFALQLALLKGTGFSPYIHYPNQDGLLAPEGHVFRFVEAAPSKAGPF